MQAAPPAVKPANANFSSGPCSKRPGYSPAALDLSILGRSHRSAPGKAALKRAIDDTARLLRLPADYLVGIVPASDTGAIETAFWNLLGPRPVDVCYWESFGSDWHIDIAQQLRLDVHAFGAGYGELPDLGRTDPAHDIVFTWNGTTSGVRVPDGDWIAADREGLTLCDATSAVFAMELPWDKLDVATFSWQKALGGEGGHGMLILSPRAVERLQSHTPAWPLPKIFRLTNNGELIDGIFRGETINTPSLLCLADYQDALNWVEAIGGVDAAIARSRANLEAIAGFVAERDWIEFLARDPATVSNTSVCLSLDLDEARLGALVKLLDEQRVAHDIKSYKAAPPGLRIWCGATVALADIEALLPWLDWGYRRVRGVSGG